MSITYYFKQFQVIAKQRRGFVFWVLLAVVLLFDLFVIQKSVRLAIAVKRSEVPEPPSQAVRINFTGFNQALKQKDDNENYYPAAVVDQNPFGLTPDKTVE